MLQTQINKDTRNKQIKRDKNKDQIMIYSVYSGCGVQRIGGRGKGGGGGGV